jgi:gluconate 2-dehydrogenase gamma chain
MVATAAVPPVLTAEERRWLGAICERIVPKDQDPGAVESGAVAYIERQLAGPLSRHRKYYRHGLAAMQALVPDFAGMDAAGQDEVLRRLEAGAIQGAAWKIQKGPAFFSMVIDHTMQSYYGPPKHGGNRGMASWKMLGIEDQMHWGKHEGGH